MEPDSRVWLASSTETPRGLLAAISQQPGAFRKMRRRISATLVLASFSLAACSTYVPIAMQVAPQSGTVRLSLRDDARQQSFGVLGSEIESIEGKISAVSDSGITIAANQVSRIDADDQGYRGESVVVPRRYVLSVSQKRTQVGRSLLLGAAITAGAIWIGHALGGGGVGYNKVGTPQPGQN